MVSLSIKLNLTCVLACQNKKASPPDLFTRQILEVFNEASIAPAVGCANISFPQTQYQVYFKRKDSEKIKNLQSVQRVTHVENGILDKETELVF